MDITIFEGIGLTRAESKVYIALLELGPTKVGKIIEKSGLQSSVVHNALHSLLDKGFVSYTKVGKIKEYQAAPPKRVIDYLEDKKRDFKAILPELELKQKLAKEKEEVELFQGTKGIMTMLNSLIEDTKKGDEYLFFTVNVKDQNEEIQRFFRKYDGKRKEKRLVAKGLAPEELKPFFKGRPYLKMKYTNHPIPSNISICNNKLAMFSWGEKPVGYLISSRQMAAILASFFASIWKGE